MGLPLLAGCVLIIAVGATQKVMSIAVSLGLFLLGLLLTWPLLLSYRTGEPKYALIYGVGLGVGGSIVLDWANSSASIWLTGLYLVACVGSGIFLLLSLFRRRFLKFIGMAGQ